MKSDSALKGLAFAEKPNRPPTAPTAPILSKRSRLLERLAEQREMASCETHERQQRGLKEQKPANKSVKKRTFADYWEVLARRSSHASLYGLYSSDFAGISTQVFE